MSNNFYKIGAVFVAVLFLGTVFVLPMSGASNLKSKIEKESSINRDPTDLVFPSSFGEDESVWLDSYYDTNEDISYLGEQNDVGYNTDVGDTVVRSLPLYVGEPVDQTVPGRGRAGSLDVTGGDDEDWYRFTVCKGQSIQATVSSGFNIELADTSGHTVSIPYTAVETGNHFVRIFSGDGDYTFTVSLNGQNDAGKGVDAGNSINQATSISPGEYTGYMSYTDQEDWYSFNANNGQGIFVSVEPLDRSDYDIHLYNPSGEYVYSAMYYGGDIQYSYADERLQYPADASGTWKIKIDIFPGWDQSKWPDNYFLYGSGAYELGLSIGGSAESPPDPIPQPDVTPVSQTFKVINDPNSNNDEYAYLSAIPAANYIQNGKRYVSPIVYTGDTSQTHWFGDVDDTTQYLLDDWETYLARHGKTPTVYQLKQDPVQAAADIATKKWASSNTAVLAIDGSDFEDDINTVIDKATTLNVKTKKTTATPGDSKFKEFAGQNSIQMIMGKDWGAMTIYAYGSDCPAVGLTNTRYELGAYEDWPHPYDAPGDNTNIYIPIATPGIYWPYIEGTSGFDTFEITRYTCDRYEIPVTAADSTIKVSVTTSQPSYLEVFLVDPYGVVRRPSIPSWNGGEINPIHIWNGDHHNGFEDWRRWEPTYSTEHTAEINYAMEGKWTAIVVPHYPYGQEKTSDSISYNIKAELREYNNKRVNAGLSASNAAVIASLKHAPLLYVKESTIPSETSQALSQLGATNIIFVNINEVSSANPSGSVTEYKTLEQVVNAIKADSKSENVITITSFGTGDGYFAPSGMIAAYHGSPVLSIGEAKEAFNILDRATSYREYSGGWYHGTRSQGHLAKMEQPMTLLEIIKGFIQGNFPPLGLDQHLRWWGDVNNGIYEMISGYGLDKTGQEAYIFVSPRNTDIRHPICRVLSGLESYAGQIPFENPALDAALISRDILYSATIYANPGRDITTAQLMNFPDGWTWETNDGVDHYVYSTRTIKEVFSSHGRFFEGHILWDNWLERMNNGVSINYYSGHGTGGSGVSAMYSNVAETYPDAELTHESLYDFDWWDSWRGYMYDDTQTKTPRWGGFTWYNAQEPNLYDIIHFKWVDQLLENLHSEIELWMSCTTGQHFGPDIYLEHGSALWYGNAGTGLCPQEDLLDDEWIKDMMINGLSVGEAFSKQAWLHQRDFTVRDPNHVSIYGPSSMEVTNVQVIFGDPTLYCYSPEWMEPTPITP